MVPNHGGDTVGSILGPMGSHWVQEMGQNRKTLPCPKSWISDYLAIIDISQKNRSYGYGAKSRWGLPWVNLGANGVPLGKKMGPKRNKLPCPKNSNFRLPRDHRFFLKMEVLVMVTNRGGDPLGSILGTMGSHSVQKMDQNRKKFNISQNSNFRLHRDHRFFPENGSYGYGAKSLWGLPRVHLGANGVPLGNKNGSKL